MTTTSTYSATEHARANEFNAANPIGTWVTYWTGSREDAAKHGQTRTRAQLLGGHTAVVWVTGQASCIALTHVDPIPGQPDDIEDDSRDLPELAGTAVRVGEYIAANGDGIYDVLDGHPLYARDLEALRRAATTVAGLRSMVAELTAELEKVRAQLTAANHHTDNLAADVRDMQKANTAYANENARLRSKLADLEAAEPTEQQYLIWSHKQGAWWGPGAHGYRWDISRAGRFPLDRAKDHASTRSWPAGQKMPPEVIIPAPPLRILADPERIDEWINEQVKQATEQKIAGTTAEQAEVAR